MRGGRCSLPRTGLPQPPLQTGIPVKSSKPPMAGIFLHAWEFSTAVLRFQETEFVGQRQAAQETRFVPIRFKSSKLANFLILSRKVNLPIYLKKRWFYHSGAAGAFSLSFIKIRFRAHENR